MFLFFQHFNTSAAAASSAVTIPPPSIHTPTFRGAVCPGPFLLVGTHEQSRRHFTPRTTRLPLQYVHSKSKPNCCSTLRSALCILPSVRRVFRPASLWRDLSHQGTVIIVANEGSVIMIPDGTVLRDSVVTGNLRILDH